MSSRRHHLETFSLTSGGAAQRGEGATRRQIANKALIRHRQKAQPRSVLLMNRDNWCQYVAWQLEWENAILRYRDGNNDDAERTIHERTVAYYDGFGGRGRP